jgi:hypothetical protein
MADPNSQNEQAGPLDDIKGTLPFLATMIGEAGPRIPVPQQREPDPPFTFEDSDAPYMPTTGFKGHTEWGKPSTVLQAAAQFPGLSPSPWMPQIHHVSDIIKKNSNYFIKNGSLLSRLYAGQMAMYRAKYESDMRKGLREQAADAHNQYVDFQTRLTQNSKMEFMKLADAFEIYKDSPDKLKQALVDLTYEFDDQPLRDVIQTQGIRRAQEVISERYNNNEDQLKIMQQRLAAEKLKEELDENKQLEQDLQIITNPNARTEAQQSYIQTGTPHPGEIPYTTSSDKMPQAPPPDYSRLPKTTPATHADQYVANNPAVQLPSTFPADVTPENVHTRRPELVDWAQRNGVAIPPSDPAGEKTWLAAHAPAAPSPPTAPGAGAPSAAPRPNSKASPEARRLSGYLKMPAEQLDRMAWDYLMYNRPGIPGTPHGKADQRRHTLVNSAVEQIATGQGGLADTIDSIIKSTAPASPGMSPAAMKKRANGILDRIGEYNSEIANQVRLIINGQTEFPRTGFGATAKGPQMLRGMVAAIDPTFDEFRFRNRVRINNAFYSNGQMGQRIVNFNTWIKHADTIAQIIDGMPNTSYPNYNAFLLGVQNAKGEVARTQFDTAMQFVSTELAKAFKGGAPSLTEIHDIKELLNHNMSPQQMRASLRVMTELAEGQLASLAGFWNLGTLDEKKPEDFITDPEAKQKFHRLLLLPASGAIGLKDLDYYRQIGAQNISLEAGALPPDAVKLQNWLILHPGDPRAGQMRDRLAQMGWTK